MKDKVRNHQGKHKLYVHITITNIHEPYNYNIFHTYGEGGGRGRKSELPAKNI